MKCIILDISPFPVHHTGINVAEALQEILKSYTIASSKVLAVIHDEGKLSNAVNTRIHIYRYGLTVASHTILTNFTFLNLGSNMKVADRELST